MTSIDNSVSGRIVAAQLSKAAYVTLSKYKDGTSDPLPAGWHVDTERSATDAENGISDSDNQFIVFVNDTTKQVVIAFKGSDTYSNFKSDLLNSGAEEYLSIKTNAESKFNSDIDKNYIGIKDQYSDYQIVTDGHSLGGGMAQTFGVEHGLSGFGQNSLPIAQGSIENNPNFNDLLGAWHDRGQSFDEVNVDGDIATIYYDILHPGNLYLDNNPTTLSSPYDEVVGAGLVVGI